MKTKQLHVMWNSTQLAQEFERKLALLERPPTFEHKCPCGAKHRHDVSVIKVDAAQFFKDA